MGTKVLKVVTFFFLLTALSRILIDKNSPSVINAFTSFYANNASRVTRG